MKKLLSILIVAISLCGAVFAEGGPTGILGGKTLDIILDLTGLESMAVAAAGVTFDKPVLDLISKDYDNTAGTRLVIKPEVADSLKITKTVYVWYYISALKGQCEIIFMPSAFWASGAPDLGYKLIAAEGPTLNSNYIGTLPVFNGHDVTSSNYNASQTGMIITSNDAGISKGFITYNLDVDYVTAQPIEYSAPWTIQIRSI